VQKRVKITFRSKIVTKNKSNAFKAEVKFTKLKVNMGEIKLRWSVGGGGENF